MKAIKSLYAKIPFKRGIFSFFRQFHLQESLYKHLYFQGEFTCLIRPGESFKIMHWGNQVENDLFWAGYGNGWESTSLRLWALLCRDADCVFDIGANTGVFALAAKAVKPNARVFAYEPISRVFDKLVQNVRLNGWDITTSQIAVSNRNAVVDIFDSDTEHVYSASLSTELLLSSNSSALLVKRQVQAQRVDQLVAEEGIPENMSLVVKIDVEMHELEVLEGFGSVINSHRPVFLVEILTESLGAKILALFRSLDYVFFAVNEGIDVKQVVELGTFGRNYLLIPSEHKVAAMLDKGRSHSELL